MAENKESAIKFRMVSTRPLDDSTGKDTPTRDRADRLVEEIDEYLKDYHCLFKKYWEEERQEVWEKQDNKPDPVPPPLTLTVMAPRGGGKTSVLLHTKELLKEKEEKKEKEKKYREIVWIEVSPWHLREEASQRYPIADNVYPFVGKKIKDNAEKTKEKKQKKYTCLQQKNPSDDNDLKVAKKFLEKAEESLKKAEEVFKSAAFLCIRREEAAQAAVAFSDDAKDYVENFSEKLSSLAAWDKFKKDLRKWARFTRKPLFFLVDDLDLTPGGSMVPLLRAIASIRESLSDIVPVITVVAADGERLRKELLREYMRDTDTEKQPRRDLPTGSQPRWSEIRNLQWVLAGREFSIVPWIPTYRIRFLAMPNPKPTQDADDRWDGHLVWAWYLGEWDERNVVENLLKSKKREELVCFLKCQPQKPEELISLLEKGTLEDQEQRRLTELIKELPKKTIGKLFKKLEQNGESLVNQYRELVQKLTLLETIGAVDAGYGNEENSWDVWKEIPAWKESKDKDYENSKFREKYEEIDKDLKKETEKTNAFGREAVSHNCFLKQFLSNLFPSNQREAVFLTNLLIQQYNQWKDKDPERSTDERLPWWVPEVRKARFLTALACNRWVPDPFARLLWDHFWPLYAGLVQKGWLEIGRPKTPVFRLIFSPVFGPREIDCNPYPDCI